MFAAISYPPIPIFELGPLNLSLHGLFAAIGFMAGAWLMLREVRKRGFDVEGATSVLTWALVASILGARLFTVPVHLGDPGYGLSNIIGLEGDFSILGGFAGGILGGLLRGRLLGLKMLPYLDMAAAGLAVGAWVGRIGDVAIVEHLGSATNFFLGYQLKPGYDVSPQHDVLETWCEQGLTCGPYHHTGLYDLVGALVLWGVLAWLARVWKSRHYGQLFSFWMIWYGLQRFFIDFARLGVAKGEADGQIADSVIGPFTGSQWGALAGALGGLILLLWFGRSQPVVSAQEDAVFSGNAADAVEVGSDASEPLETAEVDATQDT
ncbi:MAG: hypothetical protein HKN07_12145 [Acidimicrobiia bacterium]|nr:prolipoprotein diacylglyceryl transferase [Acidimicrobiia bacterium]NNF64990.1 hypothetical protein [Acidimicrobiia bacterium]